MATTLGENSVTGDQLVLNALIEYAYPNYKNMDPGELLRRMVSEGVIQMDALVEQAISLQGKLPRQSAEGRDFVDGSDAKKALTQPLVEPGKSSRRVATIKNIMGKHGALRVIVAETLTGKIYFFKIPKKAYRGLGQIRIYFNEDGSPKDGKWFKYRCYNFQELCS